jgi:hypothetical protein
MKTFRCNFSADVFARLFELVIEPDIIRLDDGQYYEAHYACCTFNITKHTMHAAPSILLQDSINTHRQNTRKGLTRIQIASCCKTNLSEDWSSYWFYLKVDMSKVPRYDGPAHPFCSPIEALTATCTTPYNHWAMGFRNCENAFHLAGMILGGRDLIEEFLAAEVWPISYEWAPIEIVGFNMNWAAQEVPFPRFGLQLRDGQSVEDFMDEVEKKVNAIIGESTMNEYKAYKNLVKHKRRINLIFTEICGEKSFRSRRSGAPIKIPAVVVASCSAAPLKVPRRRSLKKGKENRDETSSSAVRPEKTRSLE